MPAQRAQLNAEGQAIRALLVMGADQLGAIADHLDRMKARRSAEYLRDARVRIEDAAMYLDQLEA